MSDQGGVGHHNQGVPAAPPWPPPATPAAIAGSAPGEPRPRPTLASLAGVVAGLTLVMSLFWFIAALDNDNRRWPGLAVSVLFQVGGVALVLLHRSRRAETAGITLTAVGVVPILIHLFVDVEDPSNTVDSVSDFTQTATLVLLVAAAAWLAAYFFGPSRRYGIYLGAALVAMWLVAVVQIVDQPINEVVDLTAQETFTVIEPAEDSFGTVYEEPYASDSFGQFESEDDEELSFGEAYPEVDEPSGEIGTASLVFGGAYLAAAAWRDRRGDLRQGTVLFAVAVPILTLATFLLSGPLGTEGAAVLGIALGLVGVWLGIPQARRFTSWYGAVGVAVGVWVLVASAAGENEATNAAVLLVVGVGIALLAGVLGSPDDGPRPATGGGPGGTGSSAPTAAGSWQTPGPSPWAAPA